MNTQEWIVNHFEELVNKYAGKYIAVVNKNVVSTGGAATDVEKEAVKKYPDEMPSIIFIPRKEDLACLLTQ